MAAQLLAAVVAFICRPTHTPVAHLQRACRALRVQWQVPRWQQVDRWPQPLALPLLRPATWRRCERRGGSPVARNAGPQARLGCMRDKCSACFVLVLLQASLLSFVLNLQLCHEALADFRQQHTWDAGVAPAVETGACRLGVAYHPLGYIGLPGDISWFSWAFCNIPAEDANLLPLLGPVPAALRTIAAQATPSQRELTMRLQVGGMRSCSVTKLGSCCRSRDMNQVQLGGRTLLHAGSRGACAL